MSFTTRLLTTCQPDNSDTNVPNLALFSQLNAQRYPYLLKSSAVRQNNTQYDILIACPQYSLTLNSDKTLHCTNKDLTVSAGFFANLRKLLSKK